MEVFFMIYFFELSNNTFVNWLISKLAYIFLVILQRCCTFVQSNSRNEEGELAITL